jgi:hypothetical protein
MKITIIIGLPASGKTHYANTLGIPVVDDPTSLEQLPESGDFVIVDPYFCNKLILGHAIKLLTTKYAGVHISYQYFENDPVAAQRNAKLRNDGRKVDAFIDFLSKNYKPPTHYDLIPVYKGPIDE